MTPPVQTNIVFAGIGEADGAIILATFIAQALKEWGIPSPGVTQGALIYAGFKMVTGSVDVALAIIGAAILAFLLSSMTLYTVSRKAGHHLTGRVQKLLRLKPKTITAVQDRLIGSSWWVILGGRFVPAMMAPMTFMAGVCKIPVRRFYLGTGLAMVIWAGFFTGMGLIFGEAAADLINVSILPIILILMFSSILVGGIIWLIRRRRSEVLDDVF